jgi:predicted transcriptional regulator
MFEAFAGRGAADIAAARRLVRRLDHVAERLKRSHGTPTIFSRAICDELTATATRLRGR